MLLLGCHCQLAFKGRDYIFFSQIVPRRPPAQPWQQAAFCEAAFEQINLRRTCRPHPRVRSGYSADCSMITWSSQTKIDLGRGTNIWATIKRVSLYVQQLRRQCCGLFCPLPSSARSAICVPLAGLENATRIEVGRTLLKLLRASFRFAGGIRTLSSLSEHAETPKKQSRLSPLVHAILWPSHQSVTG